MFDPNQPLADQILSVADATILPKGEGDKQRIARPAGIFDAKGNYLPLGQCFRHSGLPTTCQPAEPPASPQNRLEGTWAFGGLLYNHFGHALLESTGRLWVRDHVPGIKGFLFLLKNESQAARRFVKPMLPMLHLLGGDDMEFLGLNAPVTVEKLILAPQAFGTGDMIAGSPEMRSYLARQLDGKITPQGSERLYISRRKLFSKRGRYFFEEKIEALLEAEGYTIFHPQEASLEEQAQRYAAASKILSSDSSALHFAALFVKPSCRLAIILRRPATVLQDYLTQYQWIAGLKPDVIDTLTGQYFAIAEKRANLNEVYSVLDLPALGQHLQAHGYIRELVGWTQPSDEALAAEVEDLTQRLGGQALREFRRP